MKAMSKEEGEKILMRECSYDFSKKNATNGCIYIYIYIIKKAKTYFWPLYYRVFSF